MNGWIRGATAYWVAAGVLLSLVMLLVLGMSMRKIINHDEHQFVAAGALIARQGLLPYLDFAYFHVPGLSYLYAGVFQITDRLLLAARSVSVGASWLMLALLFFAPVALLGRNPDWRTLSTGALLTLLLVSTQTFRYSTGWSWNHDVPILLMSVACWIQFRRLAGSGLMNRARDALLMGLLLGLAVAMRASFALPAISFALFLLPWPQPLFAWTRVTTWRPLFWFAAGGALGAGPAWLFLILAPAQFLFGNFEYVRLNTAHYLEVGGLEAGQAWAQKWEMTRNTLITVWRANFALVLLTAVQVLRLHRQVRWARAPGIVFLLVLIPAALISGYAPTPMQIQYIYLVFPLLGLLNLTMLHYDPMPRLGLVLLLAAAVYAATQATQDFRDSFAAALDPASWVVNQVHAEGQRMAALADHETIITLAPIYPLEGGATIHPALVSGPFGWRVANLVEPSVRQAVGIVGPEEMAQQMATAPPRALLVGIHGAHAALEPTLIDYAQMHGYVPLPVMGFAPEPGTLWLAPRGVWRLPHDGTEIRLGAGLVNRRADAGRAPGLDVELYFAANHLPARAVDVALQIWREDGTPLTSDAEALNAAIPADWTPGEAWRVHHWLPLPPDLDPMTLTLTLLDAETGAALGDAVALAVR